MAFNGMCTGNDMLYASEGGIIPESSLKIKAPKTSYIITTNIAKNASKILPINIKPTKPIYFIKENLPNWLELSFYSIAKKNGKRITALHILNKCLMSKNPYIDEPIAILYCHENETDLLRLVPFLIDLSIQMKCDIISFDYLGFGDSNTKPKNNTIIEDGETAINFALTDLKYKIENLILFGKGIGAMPAIYLSSLNEYHNCKSLVLCTPLIIMDKITIKTMRSITCKCLLIKEIESKDEIADNDMILLCREIPDEKEWLPKRKAMPSLVNKYNGFRRFMEELPDDIYTRHRSKFILKLRDYVYTEEENLKKKIIYTSSTGESTDSETNLSLGHIDKIENKKIYFEDEIKINEIKLEDKNKKVDIFNQTEVKINNDDDY